MTMPEKLRSFVTTADCVFDYFECLIMWPYNS